MNLDKEKILSIVKMIKENPKIKNAQIAKKLGVTEVTIIRWKGRLRKAGYDIPKNAGGRAKIEL